MKSKKKVIGETDPRFINLEKKIGFFFLMTVVGIVIVFVLIGVKRDVFTTKSKLYFVADSGKDIIEGHAVKLSAFKIGKVNKLTLDDIARVKVELSINSSYMKWIKTDSKARLIKEELIGDSIIDIMPGSAKASNIDDGGTLQFERSTGLTDIAEELKDELIPFLIEIKEFIRYVSDLKDDIKTLIANLNNISKSLSKFSKDIYQTKDNFDILLKNTDINISKTTSSVVSLLDSARITVENVNDTVTNLSNTISNTKGMTERIEKSLSEPLENLKLSLQNILEITEDIKKASMNVPSLVEKSDDLIDDTNDVIESLKRTWPISSNINEPEQKTINIDSYE